MVGVERLQKALRLIAATSSVKNGSGPVSAVLIAPSDAGKTEMLLSCQPAASQVVNDFTFATLIKTLSTDKPPKYLVVPDLNVIISHRPTVAALAMALLLSLMAEGVTDIPGIDEASKLKAKRLKQRGVRVAMITGMTPDMFFAKRGQWRKTGFLRRMIPIHYAYSPDTQRMIQQTIERGQDALKYLHTRTPIVKAREVAIPAKPSADLRSLSEQLIGQLTWGSYGRDGQKQTTQAHAYPFSPHKTLRQLARASAVIRNARAVTATDVAAVRDVMKFMRYDRPEEI